MNPLDAKKMDLLVISAKTDGSLTIRDLEDLLPIRNFVEHATTWLDTEDARSVL